VLLLVENNLSLSLALFVLLLKVQVSTLEVQGISDKPDQVQVGDLGGVTTPFLSLFQRLQGAT
jgi:hypothetical protein